MDGMSDADRHMSREPMLQRHAQPQISMCRQPCPPPIADCLRASTDQRRTAVQPTIVPARPMILSVLSVL